MREREKRRRKDEIMEEEGEKVRLSVHVGEFKWSNINAQRTFGVQAFLHTSLLTLTCEISTSGLRSDLLPTSTFTASGHPLRAREREREREK